MPNLIVHIGGAFLVSKLLRIKRIHLTMFLIGAVLPDLTVPIRIFLNDFLNVSSQRVDAYLEAFHTPFCVGIFALIIALFTSHFLKSFAMIFAGVILHFFMDAFQMGAGVRFLYPFNYSVLNYNLYDNSSWYGMTVTIICLWLLLFLRREDLVDTGNLTILKNGRAKLHLAICLMALYLLLPFFTIGSLINYPGGLYYKLNQRGFSEKALLIPYAKVISENPARIRKWDKEMNIVMTSERKMQKGETITLSGLFRNDSVYVKSMYPHNTFFKMVLSGVGVLLFIMVLLRKAKPPDGALSVLAKPINKMRI